MAANVDVVNTMYTELPDTGEIAPNALRSYYVDFNLAQPLEGGFAQYVSATSGREDIVWWAPTGPSRKMTPKRT